MFSDITLYRSILFKSVVYLTAGLLFGFGLALSGMTNPEVVLGFLDLFGEWNIALIFVMVSGIAVTGVGYRLIFKQGSPVFDKEFFIPKKNVIDTPLILGATLFGCGWGLYGLCPGPALASLASFDFQKTAFVIAMVVGMYASSTLTKIMKI